MRIERLFLDQVACFDHLDLTFDRGRDPEKADIHILVGPNGSGKTTVLMSLAQFFSRDPIGLEKRLRGNGSIAVLSTSGSTPHALKLDAQQNLSSEMAWDKRTLSLTERSGGLAFYEPRDCPDSLLHARELFANYQPLAPQHKAVTFSFVAFAYSGQRSVTSHRLEGIVEQMDNPLTQACHFTSKGEPQRLVQWIANTVAKEAFALARGEESRAEQRREALHRIETAISRIIGRTFAFRMDEDPLRVLASVDGDSVDLDVLPDGLKSILSWIADLLMRMDRVRWRDDIQVLDREFILFLDEIEIHLHPAWQRKVLPIVQSLFPKAQIFVSTHSPFVIASAEDAWIHPLSLAGKVSSAGEPLPSMIGNSYSTVLRDVLGLEAEFATQVQEELSAFYTLRDQALKGNGAALEDLRAKAKELCAFGEEVMAIVVPELRQVERRLTHRRAETAV